MLPTPISPSSLRQFLFQPTRTCLLANVPSSPNSPVAFITATISTPTLDLRSSKPAEPRVQILSLAVLPEYRRNGIARQLVHAAVRNLRECAKKSASTETRCIINNDTTLVTALVGTRNWDGKKFYEHGLGMQSEQEPVKNCYRSNAVPPDERDAFVVIGRMREPMSPGHFEVMF
jgi:ribosomal protein S18 acetylase RimI-like enzyme